MRQKKTIFSPIDLPSRPINDFFSKRKLSKIELVAIPEQDKVEDDEKEVEGDEGDQDLTEDRLQVHVPSVQNGDGQQVAWNEIF